MTVTSGRKWLGSLKLSDQLGSLARTLLASSTWNSTVVFLTWKASATPASRLLFRLVPSMPDTDETGFGLWPTPDASLMNLVESAASVMERRARYAEKWGNNGFGLRLQTAVKLWPTPSANEDAAGTPNGKMQLMLGNHPAVRNQGDGTLNPEFVEWLMGYPIGYTDLGGSETR
jgi:hypothetical protein